MGMLSVDKHECAWSAKETHAEVALLTTSPPVEHTWVYLGVAMVFAMFILWFLDPSDYNCAVIVLAQQRRTMPKLPDRSRHHLLISCTISPPDSGSPSFSCASL